MIWMMEERVHLNIIDNTKLGGLCTGRDRIRIQNNLDKWERSFESKKMKLDKDLCKALHRGRINKMCKY